MELSSAASPLLYAIGDVHGRADLLSALLAFVATDSARRLGEPKVMFLGDIVDRGSDSRRAMDLVVDALDRWPHSRFMLGNHDQWFLSFLNGAEPDRKWLGNGGIATLGSYGLLDDEPDYIRSSILTHHPNHARALREASIIEFDGEFAFVHAGINPLRAIDQQECRDCLWIRQPFIDHIGRFSHVIVHGHVPLTPHRPVITENRISLDTGAYATGVLSMLVIDRRQDRIELYATDGDGNVMPIGPAMLDRGHGFAVEVTQSPNSPAPY